MTKIFRTIKVWDSAKPVTVYKNLHSGLWSVRQRGLVVIHANQLLLQGVTFRVQPMGRERVLREKRKNVHAFVHGWICERTELEATYRSMGVDKSKDQTLKYQCVSYNPYKAGHFYDKATSLPVTSCDFIDMESGDQDQLIAIWRELS